MKVGDEWAYRKGRSFPFERVVVLKFGDKCPPRVKIRFVGDDAEGREEWVSPARLEVGWSGVSEFLAEEHRWEALIEDCPTWDGPELQAVRTVFGALEIEKRQVAELGYRGGEHGLLKVLDVDRLCGELDVTVDFLFQDTRAYRDDKGITTPWAGTLLIAQRAAKVHSDNVLAALEAEERNARDEAIYGYRFTTGRGARRKVHHLDPEQCAEIDRRHHAGRALVRQWCGADAVENFAELLALRQEVRRIGRIAEEAISALRSSGEGRRADGLAERLGVPLEVLRHGPAS